MVVFCFSLEPIWRVISGIDYYMKPITVLVCAAALGFISFARGQTNTSAEGSVRFFLDPVRLRTEPRLEIEKPKQIAPALPSDPTLAGTISALETTLRDGEFHSRVVRDGQFYLTRSAPRSDSPIVRFMDDVFTPEVIPWGKATLSSPIVTVIKRKNPLSLLSGISIRTSATGDGEIIFKFLEIDW